MIRIANMCYESLPCKHNVYIDGKKYFMNGVDIERLLRKHNKTNSPRYQHFAIYKNFNKK